MVHINHRIGIKKDITEVFNALSTVDGISSWWSIHTSGTAGVGGNVDIVFNDLNGKELGAMKFEISELISNNRVVWNFSDGPAEWIGTSVVFDLKTEDAQTIVLFSHRNWKEEVEFKSHCSMKWAVFLLSLKQYLETGNGNPSPNDIKIDNWN